MTVVKFFSKSTGHYILTDCGHFDNNCPVVEYVENTLLGRVYGKNLKSHPVKYITKSDKECVMAEKHFDYKFVVSKESICVDFLSMACICQACYNKNNKSR